MRNSEFESTAGLAKRNFFPLIALITAIALSIRYTIANGDSLWLDELHTAWTVSDGLPDVARRAADGNQNPLFFWLTWICTQALGASDFSLRFVSVASGTALVGVASWFTWTGARSLVGVALTAVIITLDWRFVFYGTEARPYALMQFMGLLQAGLFANLLGWLPSPMLGRLSKSTKWSALTLLSIALFYCHITCVWLFLAESLTLLIRAGVWVVKYRTANTANGADDEQPTFVKPLLLSLGAALVGCLPGALNLSQVFGRKSNWSNISSPASVIADAQEPLLFWIAFPLLLVAIAWTTKMYSPTAKMRKPSDSRKGQLNTFVLVWAVTPIIGVIAAHCLGVAPLALPRYTVIGATAMAIFAGLLMGQLPNRLLKASAIALIAWASYSNNQITQQLVNRQTLPVLRHENWDTPTESIRCGPGYEAILLFANVIEDVDATTNPNPQFQDYLRFPAATLHSPGGFGNQVFPCPTHQSPRLTEELVKTMAISERSWLLIRGSDTTVRSILAEVKQTLADKLSTGSGRKVRIQEHNDDGDVVHLFSVDLR